MNNSVNELLAKKMLQNDFSNEEILQMTLSFIDLTTLNDTDTNTVTERLAQKALDIKAVNNGKTVAAVCVFPRFAKPVSEKLVHSGIHTACVAGMFPNGQSSLNVRLADVKDAVENGAGEIDMVISRGELIEGNFSFVANEIREHKNTCGSAHLKVILETGQLNIEQVKKASEIAIENGADFIKTSTGKYSEGATLEKSLVMLQAIKSHYEKTGKKIGFKPAGGIRTVDDAVNYTNLVYAFLGKDWLSPELFRIGASSLAGNVLNELAALTKNPKLAEIM